MVISGALFFPLYLLRSYQSIFFRAKMLMLLLAGLNVLIFHSGVYQRVEKWDLATRAPEGRPSCGGSFSGAVDRHRAFGKNDCVQLVRLR